MAGKAAGSRERSFVEKGFFFMHYLPAREGKKRNQRKAKGNQKKWRRNDEKKYIKLKDN
jgi:hypothetical protein